MCKKSSLPDCPFQMYQDNGRWLSFAATEFMIEVVKKNEGVTSLDLKKKYGISENSAQRIIYMAYMKNNKLNAMPVKRFGFRDDTYFTEDYLLNGVSYSVDDLKGKEADLLNFKLPKKDKIKRWS